MAIIDLQRNHVGIQSLNTQFANYAAAGQGALLYHTDGYVYCVFARNYLNGKSHERHLYMTRSNDCGLTWSAAIDISTGTGSEASTSHWDDDPALIQLTGTDIGIVFTRDDALTRGTINKDTGVLSYPSYDQLTNTIHDKKWPSIVYAGGYYYIYCLARDSITGSSGSSVVYQYKNTTAGSLTANTWAETIFTGVTAIFPANHQPMSLSVKQLLNGDLAMVGAYRINFNGQAQAEDLIGRPGMSNLPKGLLLCDVGACFSSNNGATWTAIQSLTGYGTGTPSFSMAGTLSVASVDLQQLSDNSIVVAYQEHAAPQYMDPSVTSPFALSSSMSSTSGIRYVTLNGHELLLYGFNHATLGGVFIFDLTAQTLLTLNKSSTPALWSNTVTDIDISPDGTKLAVAMTGAAPDGGLNIFDISNFSSFDTSNWTLLPHGAVRQSIFPAMNSNYISKVRWDGNANIVFSYATGRNPWGGYYDVNGGSLVGLLSTDGNPNNIDFVILPSKIVAFTRPVSGSYSFLESVSKSTGAVAYHSNTTFTNGAALFYDSAHSELLALGTTILSRIIDNDTGIPGTSSFNLILSYNATSNPGWDGFNDQRGSVIEIPGQGLIAFNGNDSTTHQHQWYSYTAQRPAGYRVRAYRLGLGENVNYSQLNDGGGLKSNAWLALGGNDCIILQSMANVGRIRYGFFPYNTSTHQLTTAGVDFYDVCNINSVGTNMKTLQFPKFCADASNNLFWYFNRWDLLSPGGNEFAPLLATTALDSVNFTAKCRILTTNSFTFSSRARMQVTTTATLSMRMRIVFAQCLKMKARIVPRQLTTLSLRARILNQKSTTCLMEFLVQSTQTRRVRLTFYVNTGQTGGSSFNLTMKAHIVKAYTARMTGHFLVKSAAASSKLSFAVTPTQMQTLTVRARIVHG